MISSRCYYALLAVLELAHREGGGLVTIREIAKARHIPERFLEAILLQLKQHGIAHSVRGKSGGYRLVRPAAEITVTEIIRIFDHDALKLEPPPLKSARRHAESQGVLHEIWRDAEKCLTSTLNEVDFAKLVERESTLQGRHLPNFII